MVANQTSNRLANAAAPVSERRGLRRLRARGLAADIGGSVLPMAAVGAIMLLALVGGAVDMSRSYRVQNRLQNACDAGVLAGRRSIVTNGYDATAQAQAKKFFDINFDPAQQGTTGTPSFTTASDAKATAITGTASVILPMAIMRVFDFGSITISTNCSASMGVGNSDVTLVLDTTGSMGSSLSGGGTRITALRTAMKNFYATIATATNATSARVRYAVVPFSTTVRVGQLLKDLDPKYLVDSYAVQSAVPYFEETTSVRYKKASKDLPTVRTIFGTTPNGALTLYSSTLYPSGTSCMKALPLSAGWLNAGTPTSTTTTTSNGSGLNYPTVETSVTQRMTIYTCQANTTGYQIYSFQKTRTLTTDVYTTDVVNDPVMSTSNSSVYDHSDYRLVMYDTSSFKKFLSVTTPTGNDSGGSSNGSNISSIWAGCIEERQTVPTSAASYSTISGMSPTDALDLDIDSAPNPSDDATKWAPMWPDVAYWRSGMGLSSTGTVVSKAYGTWCPSASTTLRTMTSSEFGAVADGLTPNGWTYLDIGMTWGARISSPDGMWSTLVNDPPPNGGAVNRHLVFMTDGFMQTESNNQNAWGIEKLDRRATTNGSSTTSDANHSKRYRAICEAIKAKGIRIWAIQFDDTTSVLQADLAACASPNSTYAASSAAQLNAAFQEIAKQVGELRVVS